MARVLTIPFRDVRGLYAARALYTDRDTIRHTMKVIRCHGTYVDRLKAESDDTLRQIVSCAFVRSSRGILCLQRASSSNRAALRRKFTIMLGGHVDDLDASSSSPLRSCVRRELNEELGIEQIKTLSFVGIAIDPETASGCLHIGFVYEATVAPRMLELSRSHDLAEFAGRSRLRSLDFMPIRDFDKLKSRLDPWSTLVVTAGHFSRTRRPARPVKQLRLPFP